MSIATMMTIVTINTMIIIDTIMTMTTTCHNEFIRISKKIYSNRNRLIKSKSNCIMTKY